MRFYTQDFCRAFMSSHTETTSHQGASLQAHLPKWALPLTCIFVCAGLFIQSILGGKFGKIGPDSDDLMRLMQIRDFFAGQGWFDMMQYRLGLEGGTAMHWSRIPDMPLIALTWFFDLFMPFEQAEKWAFSVWPPVLSVGLILAMWQVLKNTAGYYTKVFGLIFLGVIFVRFYRFAPGAIDHHNIQLVLLAVAIAFGLDPKRRLRSFVLAGIVCAMSIAIGMEVYVFVGVICGFFALSWLWEGAPLKTGTTGFGLSLGVSLMVIYGLTFAPSAYMEIQCDAYSFIYLLAGSLGGFGLAALAVTLSSKLMILRLLGLAILGLACAALVVIVAPQCLSNPLSDLPPIVKTLWLDEIREAQSTASMWGHSRAEVAFILPVQIVALCVTAWLLMRGEDRRIFGLFFVLMLVSVTMTIYQGRFYVFGFLFSVVPLARWVGLLFAKKKRPETENSLAYIGALALSLPFAWAMPFLLSEMGDKDDGEETFKRCHAESVYEALNALPPGIILAGSNAGPDIIGQTPHHALNGNYHRNVAGIKASIDIFLAPAEEAKALLQTYKVDYLHFCRTTRETTVMVETAPDGLFGSLSRGIVPDYLVPIGPDLEDGAVTIYRIN